MRRETGMRKQVSWMRKHRRVEQVLLREESTPGKPTLALRGATHEAKRRGARERAGR